jgi:uncharacterized protein
LQDFWRSSPSSFSLPGLPAHYWSRPSSTRLEIYPTDLVGRSVDFPSESGSRIRGWFLPGQTGYGTIILLHGVRASRLDMLDRARFLSRAGYSVLLFDFQAHGETAGRQITFGFLESRDAQAAVRFVRELAPGENIGVIGVSMGGAAALLSSPPLSIDAIVLEQVYPTLDQAIGDRISMRLGSWSRSLTPLLSWQIYPRLGIHSEALRPVDHAGRIMAPKLSSAGPKINTRPQGKCAKWSMPPRIQRTFGW